MVVRSLSYLVLLLVVGCASKQVPHDPCNPDSRTPSSLTCEKLFEGRSDVVLSKSSQEIVDKLPAYFEKVKALHALEFEKLNDYTVEINMAAKITIAEGQYLDYIAGSPMGKALLDLGYRVDQIPRPGFPGQLQKVLRPDLNLSKMYQKIYTQLLKNVDQGMSFDDLILPALIFERSTSNGFEYVLSRPGLDPIPEPTDGWKLAVNSELATDVFAMNIAQGKMPFESRMYHHDIAHVVDYIQSPALMKKHRAYFKLCYELGVKPGNQPAIDGAGLYLNEFLMFPKVEKRGELSKILQTKARDKAGVKKRIDVLYDQLATGELFKRVDALNNSFFQLFEVHGGGMLDGISLHRFVSRYEKVVTQTQMRKLSSSRRHISYYLADESAWGLLKQMVVIKEVLEAREPLSSDAQMIKNGVGQYSENLPWLLVTLMDKFEFKTSMALRYGMSAENLFTDILSPNFKKTNSYKYYITVATKPTLEYQLFVEGRYLPTPAPKATE